MKRILPLLSVIILMATTAWSQKVVDRVVDNKGTIRWVLDSTTAVITRGDSTLLYVTPTQMKDTLTKFVRYTDTSAMLSNYINDAGNGLTKQGQKVLLGGVLSQPTTIQTSASNFLKITGLQSGNTTDSVMTVDPSTGQLKFISASSLFSNLTANNGLTKTGNNIQLGGALNQATTITTTASNTLAVAGLQSGNLANDSIVVADPATGVLKRVSAATLLQSGDQSFTASAGQTAYTVTNMPGTASRVWVFRNGVKLLAGTDYTASAGSVTLTPTATPPNDWSVAAGDIIEVQWVK
ncbi:hypothetical protein ACTHGU_04855 [Chitinophagaceae bacterium MMS25-I14]